MPSTKALSKSLWSARRLRSRQTIWKTGSIPAWTSLAETASEPSRMTAVWMSVTLIAATLSFIICAAFERMVHVHAFGRADLAGEGELSRLERLLKFAHGLVPWGSSWAR